MISVRNVTKRFGSQLVLNNVSINIEDGKVTAVVGPSGVGKSVLIKLIMGIMDPDKGEIFIFDKDISKAHSEREKNEIRKDLGVLFQSAALFDSLSVYENIAFPLRQRETSPKKISNKEIHDRVVFMLEALSLEEYAWSYPQEIPLGTRKRVGMARALITHPRILLFDEPNTGLDPLVGQEVYDLIKTCRQKWGFTGVVISHEIPEVFQVSDTVAMLLNGRFIEIGPPAVIQSSQNPYVRQFLNGQADGPIRIQ